MGLDWTESNLIGSDWIESDRVILDGFGSHSNLSRFKNGNLITFLFDFGALLGPIWSDFGRVLGVET